MGFAFPAAIGAKMARPEKAVWCVAGEGGFVMTAQELSVAVRHRLDVKVVLLNNFSLGMVRQFQDDFYVGCRSEVDLSEMPDFVKLAEAYGLPGVCVETVEQIKPAFDFAERTPGPVLIDFRIDPEANVYPIVPLGRGLNDFWELPDEYASVNTSGVSNGALGGAAGNPGERFWCTGGHHDRSPRATRRLRRGESFRARQLAMKRAVEGLSRQQSTARWPAGCPRRGVRSGRPSAAC